MSGWLREHWGSTLSKSDLEPILASRMPSVGEKAERVLLHLAKAFPTAGATMVILNSSNAFEEGPDAFEPSRYDASDAALQAAGYCEGPGELYFLLEDCLTRQSGFLKIEPGRFWPSKITPAGWARIHELQQGHGTGAVGFIAMWFSEEVKPTSEAIHRAISAAGYDPVRIDRVEHNNPIDDEIIARIRGSRFLVADLTKQRGGVYFEAGFALGLGLPVIWLCREDDLDNVHFDNRQYNFILWKPDALDDLERRLQNRIEATLGRGPLAPAGAKAGG